MYSLSIFFGPSPVPAQFLFKEQEKAGVIYNAYVNFLTSTSDSNNGLLIGSDDYGQSFAIDFANIHAVILENMILGEESRIQRGLSQARGQANANKRAQSDPVIMAAQRGAGPSVLTPFGNGRFNG